MVISLRRAARLAMLRDTQSSEAALPKLVVQPAGSDTMLRKAPRLDF